MQVCTVASVEQRKRASRLDPAARWLRMETAEYATHSNTNTPSFLMANFAACRKTELHTVISVELSTDSATSFMSYFSTVNSVIVETNLSTNQSALPTTHG